MRQMVELFGADYPIISINPHGRHGEPIPPSIEKMAADRLPLILERQASGPFLLGGKCNGAMVAFEAARLLMAAGHMVDMVAMVDPPTVSASLALQAILGAMRLIVSHPHLRWTYELMALLERFFNAPTSQHITIARLHKALSNPGNPNYEVPPATWSSYSSAMAQYRPLSLDVPVIFYAAGHNGHAWRRISSRLEVIQLPGGHPHCLTIGSGTLVEHLRQRIDALAGGALPASDRAPRQLSLTGSKSVAR